MYAGNGDGANQTTANLALRSSFGIGFGPNVGNMTVPIGEYSHWFDVRTGNMGMRGTLSVGGAASAQTPAASDISTRLATTEWVVQRMTAQAVGTIVLEMRTSVRAGCLKLNGALLRRVDYPELWAYAQASGAIVADADWGSKGLFGCFSNGDGATTFRIPEFRGEYPRFWDDGRGVDSGRGIGTWQDSQNRSHAHGASSSSVGDHVHSAWTDVQGYHNHSLSRHALITPASGTVSGSNGAEFSDAGGGPMAYTGSDGNHGHNVGIGAAGAHAHAITVYADGGAEARVRSLAMLAMIRAY